jgi:HEAT repeat protein
MGILAVALAVVLLVFGNRGRQEVIFQALASPQEAKVAWATTRLKRMPEKGVSLVLSQLGRRGDTFDIHAADYCEEIGFGDRLPADLRVRAALAKLDAPLLAAVGLARLMELPGDALPSLLEQARALPAAEMRAAALAAVKVDAEASRRHAYELLGRPDLRHKCLALALLAALADPADADRVTPCLDDTEYKVRVEAVYALARIQKHDSLSMLAPLLSDPSPEVRLAATKAFSAEGEAGDGEILVPVLFDEDEEVRAQAVLALGDMGAKGQLDDVTELAEDPSDRVRTAVAAALGVMGNQDSVDVLVKLSTDRSESVRAAAATGLATFASNGEAFDALGRCADDPSADVARSAYRSMVARQRPESVRFFIEQLTNERPSWVSMPGTSPESPQGDSGKVRRGALAACALIWLTGNDFGYDAHGGAQKHRAVQARWEQWWRDGGSQTDFASVQPPEGLRSYEQLLDRVGFGSPGRTR